MEHHPPIQPAVVIVDDDPMIRLILERLLDRQGCAVIVAGDGAAALATLHTVEYPPALIITDVTMPHMNGIEFCDILAHHAAWSNIPIVLMSGGSDVERLAAQTHAVATLSKPFNLDAVLVLIDRWCFNHLQPTA